MPAISVVMSVYQDTRFFGEAVQSILNQTFADFELIVIDDGSDDPSPVLALDSLDPRIRTMANEKNLGLARSLNKAIAAARAPLIARMDADDISLPQRLEELWSAFDQDPDLVLAGTNYTIISEEGVPQWASSMPEDHAAIIWACLFMNPFSHTSVAFRKSAFDNANGYDARFESAQDYELWMRMLRSGRARILRNHLVQYRVNLTGITSTNKGKQYNMIREVQKSAWSELGFDLPQQIDVLKLLAFGSRLTPIGFHLNAMQKYLELYCMVLPRLPSVFPSVMPIDAADLGRRLLDETRHCMKLFEQEREGAEA